MNHPTPPPREPRPADSAKLIGDDSLGLDADDAWLRVARRVVENDALGEIAGYTVMDVCARGAQGTVYRARRRDGSVVALKRLHGGASATLAARGRLKVELDAMARLHHPNIVRAREAQAQGDVLIEMEWVDGLPLTTWTRHDGTSGRRANADLLRVFMKICDAVGTAHDAGIVHRDLKPSNILVDQSGSPRLLDFGLAKAAADLVETRAHATMTGQFIGTPLYAAPEQIAHCPSGVDTRSDLYSIGVLLYEAFCGRGPYPPGLSLGGLLHEIEHGIPRRPRQVDRSVPRPVEAVILKAMARRPDDRYRTAHELRDDLERCLSDSNPQAPSPSLLFDLRSSLLRHPVQSSVIISAVTLLVVVLGVVSAYTWRLQRAHDDSVHAHRAADRVGTFLGNLFLEGTAAAGSTDGARHVLDDAAAWIDSEMSDDSWAAARTNIAFGQMYAKLEAWESSQRHIASALDTYRSLGSGSRPEVAEALRVLGLAGAHLGHPDAVVHAREALAMIEHVQSEGGRGVANYWTTLGEALLFVGGPGSRQEADRCFAKSVEILGGDDPPFPTWTGSVLTTQARGLMHVGAHDTAVTVLREVLDLYDRHGVDAEDRHRTDAHSLLDAALSARATESGKE